MNIIPVIFVKGSGILSKVISEVTEGEYTHVAIKIAGGVVESCAEIEENILPGVRLSLYDKYDDLKFADKVKIINCSVDDKGYVAALSKAKELIGRPYGYYDCIKGGLCDYFKHPIIRSSDEGSMDCSETATRILRAAGINVLEGIPADAVTPMDLYNELI